jgi:hypothetical protein
MEELDQGAPTGLCDYCSFCGFAITPFERGCIMFGEFVDRDLNRGVLNVTLCNECWAIVLEIEQGGLPRATAKTRACQSNDKEDSHV